MDQLKQALTTMYLAAPQAEKAAANTFLHQFQKLPEAWEVAHAILADKAQGDLQAKMFAAQTLRMKMTYDLNQVPALDYDKLKQSLFELLEVYNTASTRLVRTQLCIALAQLALQHLSWQNAMEDIIGRFLALLDTVPTLLEVLKIVPEELSEVKKTTLTDDEFNTRTLALITDEVPRVLGILRQLAEKRPPGLAPLILDALNSWLTECPIETVVAESPLMQLVFELLLDQSTFDQAVDCLVTVLRETRDIDNPALISQLLEQLLRIHHYFEEHPDLLDLETVEGLTRLFVEAGELWHVLVAKNPDHFMPLVRVLLKMAGYDADLDVVKYTFPFWYQLKQIITLPKFDASKQLFAPVYVELIETLIKHLTYPIANDDNLFDGDREAEDKFKEFRYDIGDVLKDCCAVVGLTKALLIPFDQIQRVLADASSHHWQYLEAPLFSMRTMAKEVPLTEKTTLPSIMTYLVQLPEHPKLRYAATLVLGRYTEWTAHNPEFLEPQLNYIIKGFEIGATDPSKGYLDIVVAASHALMYFCQDCLALLVNYLEQLWHVYDLVKAGVDIESHYELARGLGCVIAKVPQESQYATLDMFIGPTLTAIANAPDADTAAEQLEVVTEFASALQVRDFEPASNAAAQWYLEKCWPHIPQVLEKYSLPAVSERACRVIKQATQLFSTYLLAILPAVAQLLHQGFAQTHYGCYLWVLGVLIREYGDEYTEGSTKNSIYDFGVTQALAFFGFVSSDAMNQCPDVVEDFYRMMSDLLMFFPEKLVANPDLLTLTVKASEVALTTVTEHNLLVACLHFLIDLVSWGLPHPPVLFFEGDCDAIREQIRQLLVANENGLVLIKVVINGIIFSFASDVIQDANDLILKVLTVIPDGQLALTWLKDTACGLPNVSSQEIDKLLSVVLVALANRDNRRVRSGLKDFVSWYSRKNVIPRTQFE